MKITDLIVEAEEVNTGVLVEGFVCGCDICSTPVDSDEYDRTRPIGRLTYVNGKHGGIRVYTDNMRKVDWIDD